MVKADAYGHGLQEVAKAAEDIVDGFGVATLEEGLKLREIGINKPILTLISSVCEIEEAAKADLTVCVGDKSQIDEISRLVNGGAVASDKFKIHIAVDSGMHRLGFCEDEIDNAIKSLKALGISVNGVYSHLRARSQKQIRSFDRVCAIVNKEFPNAIRHLASSHSFLAKRLRYDAVRVGISAYKGAMSVESEVIKARRVCAGEFVSYGNFKLKRDCAVAVVFGGYADGVAREFPSSVYICGRECKVIGNVCMDVCIVDCGDYLPKVGEKVTLLSADTIDKAAKQRRSIVYTLSTCWKNRIERIYEYDKSGSEKTCQSGGYAPREG